MLPSKFLNFFEEFITEALFPASPGAHQYRGFLFSSLSAPDSPHCTPFKDIKNLLFHSLTGRSSSPSSHITSSSQLENRLLVFSASSPNLSELSFEGLSTCQRPSRTADLSSPPPEASGPGSTPGTKVSFSMRSCTNPYLLFQALGSVKSPISIPNLSPGICKEREQGGTTSVWGWGVQSA